MDKVPKVVTKEEKSEYDIYTVQVAYGILKKN